MKKIAAVFLLVTLILIPAVVFADALGGALLEESVGSVGLESDVETSVATIIKAALAVTGTMFLILTVAAGIMWMTAAGNEEKIEKAKKVVIGATIGLIIIIFAYTITFFVTSRIQGAEGGGATGQTCASKSGWGCVSSCPSADSFYASDCPSGTPVCCSWGD